jgi:hypothetical protein
MPIITMDTLKTIGQGALGAMTFGAYHQYTTNKIMELNNEKIELQHKYFMDKMEDKYKKEEDIHIKEKKEMNDKIERLERMVMERQNWFWWIGK